MNVAARAHSVTGTCGPLLLRVQTEDPALEALVRAYLDLFDRRWTSVTRIVRVRIARSCGGRVAAGSFLQCGQMQVDGDGSSFLASTRYGICARGSVGQSGDSWQIDVPENLVLDEPQIGNLEDVFSLICTAAWRAEGWIALHAGAVLGPFGCALLCAPSGGGKSTLTAALLAAGWRMLGDDKVLLRAGGSRPQVRALSTTLNLHPQTQRWLPLAGIEELPRYSAWTEKRRVGMAALTGAAQPGAAAPAHLIRIERTPHAGTVRATRMSRDELLPALLRQIVIPRESSAARSTLRAAAECAAFLKSGVHLKIGNDAYADARWQAALERALSCTP